MEADRETGLRWRLYEGHSLSLCQLRNLEARLGAAGRQGLVTCRATSGLQQEFGVIDRLAPRDGFEPQAKRLSVACSTADFLGGPSDLAY